MCRCGCCVVLFSSRRRHTRCYRDWSSDVCSSDLVMGGFHATLAPDECGEHADACVLGEAEESWPRLLRDFQAGRLQPRYQAEKLSDLKTLPVPRYDLLNLKRYKLLNIPSQTTR